MVERKGRSGFEREIQKCRRLVPPIALTVVPDRRCAATRGPRHSLFMSLHEVAKRAGVSTATVSRTINRPADVDPKTAERVWKAIRELDYLPNIQARSLVSGRSRILGLIVSDITNPFFPELLKEFENLSIEHDYEILVSSTNYDAARMEICVRRMLQRKVEGVAIMTSEMSKSFIDEFSRRNVPLVFLDVGVPKDRISNVRVDYRAGIAQAVEHLLSLVLSVVVVHLG